MGVKKSVFASRPERVNYNKLCRTWGDSYRIYHNLPFCNIFTPEGLIDVSDPWRPRPLTLTNLDVGRLKKTSVDYTLCDEAGAPLLCVDFDGIQDGISAGVAYHPGGTVPPSPWRQEITELKLRVALGSVFPYFVVGSKHFDDLSANVKLTLVDGIIGEVLASRAVSNRLSQGFEPEVMGWVREDFDSLPLWDQQEVVQDWAIGVEVEAEMTHNPVTRKQWSDEYASLFKSYSSVPRHYPAVDPTLPLHERARQIDRAKLLGTTLTIHRPDIGDIHTTV